MPKVITLTFKDSESLDFWEYATGQGSIYAWSSDKDSLTAVIREADQSGPDKDGLFDQAEDFEESFGSYESGEDLLADSPAWPEECGVSKVTITQE